jgi:hypothetical protein
MTTNGMATKQELAAPFAAELRKSEQRYERRVKELKKTAKTTAAIGAIGILGYIGYRVFSSR